MVSGDCNIITARIQRMREGNSFSLCVSSHLDWVCLPSQPGGGDTYLSRGDTYLPWSGPGGGGYLPWQGGTYLGGEVPTLAGGTYLGRGDTYLGRGVPTLWGGVPTLAEGVPTFPVGGVPTFPGRNSIACACYAAGGMPLAFTQEDFLCGSKRLGCPADFYTVSRCHTRGESEDHTSDKACKGSTLALKPRADVTRSPKQASKLKKKFFNK